MLPLDKDYQISLGKTDPELEQLLATPDVPIPEFDEIQRWKAVVKKRVTAFMAALGQPTDIKQTELQYPTYDGSKLRAKLHQSPANRPMRSPSPLIVFYHGGGYCAGGPESEEVTCRNLVRAFDAVVVSIQYRLAPEFKFPTGVKDAWAALKWAASNATSWGADPISAGFVVAGTSAGGNFASILAHLARDEKLSPPLTGQYLAVPQVLHREKVPEEYKPYYLSCEQNRDAPLLPVAALNLFDGAYEPDVDDTVLFSSLLHPKGHADLPRAYFQVDGLDTLRDDGLIYERVLAEDFGIPTRLDVYPGLPHAHWLFYPSLKGSEKFRRDQIHGLAWLLKREPDFTNVIIKGGGGSG